MKGRFPFMPASGTPAQAAQKRRVWPGASAAGKCRRRETGDELALEAYSLALHSYRVVFSEEPASFRRVSVLIPCFGKAAWLEECVRSVLAQTKPADNICILLMDRKSRRMKAGLEALSPAVRCICSERLGVCRARNVLAQNCPTEFFVFLDADDTLAPDFLEKTSARRADFVFSSCRILENGIIRERVELPSDLPCPFLCNNLTGIFRKRAFFALGALDPAFEETGREDTDFLLSVAEGRCSVAFVPDTFYCIRRDTRSRRWLSSSFIYSDNFRKNERRSADRILRKHRAAVCANFARNAAVSPEPENRRKLLLQRYAETGDPAFLHTLSEEICEREFPETSCGFASSAQMPFSSSAQKSKTQK